MKASATVEIDRPREAVFEYVSTVENMEHWVAGVGDTRLVAGDGTGVGDRYETTYSYSGRTTDMTIEVTAYAPPERIGMSGDGPFAFAGLLELESTGEGTRVTNTIDNEADGRFTAFMFTVFRPVMRWLMARQLRRELHELRTILEAEGSDGSTGADTSGRSDPDASAT